MEIVQIKRDLNETKTKLEALESQEMKTKLEATTIESQEINQS